MRYEELQNELHECLEECRINKQNIVNTLIAVGTILGILFGASKIVNDVDNTSIFLLTSFIFIASFLYVANIGIDDILLTYYKDDLIKRLRDIQYGSYKGDDGEKNPYTDDDKRGEFLNYSEYSKVIKIQNFKESTTIYSFIYFINKYISLILICAFSLYMIWTQYNSIPEHNFWISLVFWMVIIILAAVVAIYMRLIIRAEEIVQCAFDYGHEYRKGWIKKRKQKFIFIRKYFGNILYI